MLNNNTHSRFICRYKTVFACGNLPRQYFDVLNEVSISTDNCVTTSLPDKSDEERLIQGLLSSSYVSKSVEKQTNVKDPDSATESEQRTGSVNEDKTLTFDLKLYIEDKKLKTGKTDYDRNIHLCNGIIAFIYHGGKCGQ